MRLIKAKLVTVKIYQKIFDGATGTENYVLQSTTQILAEIKPLTVAKAPDYQVDITRIKDHWFLISNEEVPSGPGTVVQFNDENFTVLTSENFKYLDPRTGYYRALVKFGVDQAYGLS